MSIEHVFLIRSLKNSFCAIDSGKGLIERTIKSNDALDETINNFSTQKNLLVLKQIVLFGGIAGNSCVSFCLPTIWICCTPCNIWVISIQEK